MVLVQPVSLEPEYGEEGKTGVKEGEGKKKEEEDGVKILLTVPSVQVEDGSVMETIELSGEERATPVQDLQVENGEREDEEVDGEEETKTKCEEKQHEEKEEKMTVEADVHIQEPYPVPIPDSKEKKEAVPDHVVDTKLDGCKEEDKPSQDDKQDKQVRPESSKNAKELSSVQDSDTTDTKPIQQAHHHELDSMAASSHPLKPLPNIDEGITMTKSEPRLPLLPPIGSKKTAASVVYRDDGSLKSQSATLISSNFVSAKEAVKGSGERRKEKETVTRPLSDLATTTKKKKSAGSLRSMSGSSISKSKKSSSGSATVSLGGARSKSRESLKSGSQGRVSATNSRSSDNLVSGSTKKMSVSRESLKAASQVYSSAPPTKNADSLKKGDSGRHNSSAKSKEALKDKESKNGGPHKSHDKKEEADVVGGNNEEVPSSEEKSKDQPACKDASEKTILQQSSVQGERPSKETLVEKKQDKNATKAPAQSTSAQESQCPTEMDTPNNSETKKGTTKPEKIGEEKAGKQDEALQVENSEADESAKLQSEEILPPTITANESAKEKKEESLEVLDPNPSKREAERDEVRIKGQEDKENRKISPKPQEDPRTSVSPIVEPNESKETTAVTSDNATSRISSADLANKLEIDKKTGQSEQSIVEAVEKSTELPLKAAQEVTATTAQA